MMQNKHPVACALSAPLSCTETMLFFMLLCIKYTFQSSKEVVSKHFGISVGVAESESESESEVHMPKRQPTLGREPGQKI